MMNIKNTFNFYIREFSTKQITGYDLFSIHYYTIVEYFNNNSIYKKGFDLKPYYYFYQLFTCSSKVNKQLLICYLKHNKIAVSFGTDRLSVLSLNTFKCISTYKLDSFIYQMCALPNGKLAVSCVNQSLVILSIDNSAEHFIIKDELSKKLYHPIVACGANIVLYFKNLLYFRKHEEPYSFITKKIMNGAIRHIYSLKYRNSLCVLYEESTDGFFPVMCV